MKLACVSAALAVSTLLALPMTAYATDIEQLSNAYSSALRGYQAALDEREANSAEIESLKEQIQQLDNSIARSQNELGETAALLYKESEHHTPVLDLIMGSSDFHDAVMRYDMYERVERYCVDRIQKLNAEQEQLGEQRSALEARKVELESKVTAAKKAADDAHKALLDAQHADGAKYFQVQGNNSNCGATSFIVCVNTLLHENRYTDNVAVWSSPSFGSDSTVDLVGKGRSWLLANGLADTIEMEYVPGDIHNTDELIAQLNQGRVVMMSAGPGSVWQRADNTETSPNVFSGGHYAMWYRYADGLFYCNDSSVQKEKGAGVTYTVEEMQQWLDGRGNHFAAVLYKK